MQGEWVRVHHDELDADAVISADAADQWGRLGWQPVGEPTDEKRPLIDDGEVIGEPADATTEQRDAEAPPAAVTPKPTSKKAGTGPADKEDSDGE